MTRLVLICGEGILLDEEKGGRADTVVVRPRSAGGLARLNGRRAVTVLVETGEVLDAGLRARRRDALRMDLARYGARIDEIAGPAHAAPALADIAARALRRFAAAPAQTWVLAETLPALEAAAGLGCRRALLR
ncbi:MAG: hypothetical protein IRY94_17805, partial [Rhodospirillaceae bacterium]|nr:hypothetical protein [Rhodospirillaceae bacterium]